MIPNKTRRKFLTTGFAAASGIIGSSVFKQNVISSAAKNQPKNLTIMPERVLGKTGVNLPIFGLGGAGQTPLSWDNHEQQATAIIQRAIELGVRYFDTASSYGPSEDYLGKVLPKYRKQIFLASKTAQRDRDGVWRELERSLKRLNTNYLDLWQLHHISFEQELNKIFGKNGAIKALEEAKEQKLVRFLGITGHHEPNVIAEGLRRYNFDTTLVCINAADKHHPRPFITNLLPVAREKNVGVIAMKVPAYGRLFKPDVLAGMEQAMGYTLSQPGVHCCIIAAETVAQLESNVAVACSFKPLNQAALKEIEQRTAMSWEDNNFFRAWT